MTLEEIIIIIFRLIGSFAVFIHPFYGAISVILIDFSDLILMNFLKLGGVSNYQTLDKILDISYMITFLIIMLRFNKRERYIGYSLFIYRIIGVIIYEISKSRIILFIFPNFFEVWIIGISALNLSKNHSRLTKKNIYLLIIPLFAIKIFQEYILHINKVLDNYTLIEFIEIFIK
ncbi:MAG: hypothetical protein CL766_07735 [Chloroflexi bacterium]|nr:hypothetical protein [Chloroflexota bacterium]|tara:strand:- start:22106 stop:22630 length:525 start_codon:yes stop_codon:yes gene_type:complete